MRLLLITLLTTFLFLTYSQVSSQTQELWGYTYKGGEADAGVIYKIDTSGNNYQVVKEFKQNWGRGLTKMTKGSNGKLYGNTSLGGLYGYGVIHEIDPLNNERKVLHHFAKGQGRDFVEKGLIEISNDLFIGFYYKTGVLFKFNVSTKQYSEVKSSVVSISSMLKTSDGKIFGTGTNSFGRDIIYEFKNSNNTFSTKYTFPSNRINGRNAWFDMIELTGGKLYGTTYTSNSGGGVIFEYNYKTNTFTKRVTLNNYVGSGMTKHSNGKMYFYTSQGGVHNAGSFYEYESPKLSAKKLFDLDDEYDYGDPLELPDKRFLIPVIENSNFDEGIFMKYDIDSNDLDTTMILNRYGKHIPSGFIEHSSLIYSYSENDIALYNDSLNTLGTLFLFGNRYHGSNPQGTLIQGSDGMVYGAISGYLFNSNLFRINPSTLEHEVLHRFGIYDSSVDLSTPNPNGELIEYQNRYLYGAAHLNSYSLGINDVLFRYDIQTDSLKYVAEFPNTGPYTPLGKMQLTDDGRIIGVCRQGLSGNTGAIFEYNILSDTLIFYRSNSHIYKWCYSGLIKKGRNEYYGVNRSGKHEAGSIFEFNDSTKTVKKIIDFRPKQNISTLPNKSSSNVIRAANGMYYGVSEQGGSSLYGTLYEYNDTATINKLQVKASFNDSTTGSVPMSHLTLVGNKLYGTTFQGSANKVGTIFEYNYVSDSLRTVFSFDTTRGASPRLGGIALINSCRSPITMTPIVSCDSFIWVVNNLTYYSSGIYYDTLTNTKGCDSIISLDLTILNSSDSNIIISACNNYTWSHNNNTYNTSGVYSDTLINSLGCDSIIKLNLTISNSLDTIYNTTCDSFLWSDNNTYYTSGIYFDTLTNRAGCDSIVGLDLTILNSSKTIDIQSACDSFIWAYNNQTYYTSGIYNDTLTNKAGCDSIVSLDLTILNSFEITIIEATCDSFIWSNNNFTYYNSGIYTDTLTSMSGCDSIVSLDLTISYSSEDTTIIKTACDSFMWANNNLTYYNSGIYFDTLTNDTGCDSIVFLNLTILNSSKTIDTQSACDSFIWAYNSQTYYTSGIYNDTLTNKAGCDSIVSLDLTILNSFEITIIEAACDSFIWSNNNFTYYNSGIYTDTLTSMSGCDSIVSLDLTISYSSEDTTIIKTACDSFIWVNNNNTYYTSGIYSDTMLNKVGCDSIVFLNLMLLLSTDTTISEIALDSFIWLNNNQTYFTSGFYYDTLTNKDGCDSIVTLDLEIDKNAVLTFQNGFTLGAKDSADSYQWLDCNNNYSRIPGATNKTYTATKNGSYAVEVTNNGIVDTSRCITIAVGIVENNISNLFTIYPNPASNTVTIQSNLTHKYLNIQVRNTTGQIVSESVFRDKNKINLEINGKSGVYFVHISDFEGKTKNFKIIKK